ncbi:MAG: NAD(+) synthase [Bacteroidetes bacterium RIFCSPLOWO2_12_FULL_35_15]|nr:MAG: NAD(+) synthase [Bacteroidetes bacterium RIFCSPLOWO2_12_FULL_35_15]
MKKREVIDHIVNWLSNYSNQSKTNGFVIGISGGIDSALTSTLCAKTEKSVICLNMPIHQHKAEYDRGHEHINWLKSNFKNVTSQEVELTETFKSISVALPSDIQDWLTMANTRSRLRMTTLYAFACHHKMLVVGTGNKVEDFGIGFFTKYGDGGVDISPIADLMKSDVFALAKEVGVVTSIQSAKPTDGLFADSRSDEDQIGATYDELEQAMKFIANPQNFSTLTERQKTVLDIYTRMNKANQHKMNPIPVCIIPRELK